MLLSKVWTHSNRVRCMSRYQQDAPSKTSQLSTTRCPTLHQCYTSIPIRNTIWSSLHSDPPITIHSEISPTICSPIKLANLSKSGYKTVSYKVQLFLKTKRQQTSCSQAAGEYSRNLSGCQTSLALRKKLSKQLWSRESNAYLRSMIDPLTLHRSSAIYSTISHS